jgi:DNA-binding beta-propeller fold protein YncE
MLGLQLGAQAAPIAYVSSQDGGIAVIDVDRLAVVRTIGPGGKGPRGIAVTNDGRFLLAANKLTGDLSVVNTTSGAVERRIPIGTNPEFIRIFGDLAYVTYEPGETVEQKAGTGAEAQAPAEVAVIDLERWSVIRSVPSGHETEGIEFSRDGKYMVVTNEGDNTVSVYDRHSMELVKTLKTDSYGNRPRGIKAFPGGQGYAVTLEFSDRFLVLDDEFNIVKSVATKKGPYGVGFDPEGQRLYIAASKSEVLEVFDAKTYEKVGEIPVGKRCWHFTFTPDGSKILVACGRSNALYVVDPRGGKTLAVIGGLKNAWGVVTYPKAPGSLDTP